MAYTYEIVIQDAINSEMTISELSSSESEISVMATKNIFATPSAEAILLGFMPPCVKSISPIISGEFVVVVERQPEMRTVKWSSVSCNSDHEHPDGNDTFTLPVPWTHWFLNFGKSFGSAFDDNKHVLKSVSLYFSQSKITGLDHRFYTPWMSNVMAPSAGYSANMMTVSHQAVEGDDAYIGNRIYQEHDDDRSVYRSTLCTGFGFSELMGEIDLSDPGSSYVFTQIYDLLIDSYWNGTFNCDTFTTMWPFEHDKSEFDDVDDFYLGDYSCSHGLYSQWQQIEFNKVLETVFPQACYEFTYMDWINRISQNASENSFDFKKVFNKSLDLSKAIKVINPNLVVKPVKTKAAKKAKKVNATTANGGYWLDDNGSWRGSDGRFVSHEEVRASMLSTEPEMAVDIESGSNTSANSYTANYNHTFTTNTLYTSNNNTNF